MQLRGVPNYTDATGTIGKMIYDLTYDFCHVEKNKLLKNVRKGQITYDPYRLEVHDLFDNSPTRVNLITPILNSTGQLSMLSCDYGGGAWFRSQSQEFFYNPEDLHISELNSISSFMTTSFVNSRRGYYLNVSIW